MAKEIKVSEERWLCSDEKEYIEETASSRILTATCFDYEKAISEKCIINSPGQPVKARITVTIEFL